VSAEQPDRARPASANSLEPIAEEDVLADLQAIGGHSRAGVVAHGRAGAVQVAVDVGAEQIDRAILACADGFEPIAEEDVLVDP
jgi:hypothetical protein